MDHANRGKKALNAGEYEEAITCYTAALETSPTSPDYLIQRSTAYLRAKKAPESLADADSAVLNAQKRAKRELIVEAQFRRGCALFNLERFGDAEFVFGIVKRMDDKHKMVPTWQAKTTMALNKIADEGDERRKCIVKETPEVVVVSGAKDAATTNFTGTAHDNVTPTTSTTVPSPAFAQTPADKIRHEWYQNTENVYFTLLARQVPKDKASVEILERSLSISFPLATGSSFDFTLDPFFAPVVPEKCITRILPAKVEIILVKATPGQKWSAIESKEPLATTQVPSSTDDNKPVAPAVATNPTPIGPAYPTSSKSGPKDWDKVTKEAQAQLRDPSKKTSETTDAVNDDDDEFEGGDEASHFFKKLFKGASPEVQRAMMKSYTESNGTALSTNWDEVSKGKVETVPPDGMEARKWSK